jgi:hypothetical protein
LRCGFCLSGDNKSFRAIGFPSVDRREGVGVPRAATVTALTHDILGAVDEKRVMGMLSQKLGQEGRFCAAPLAFRLFRTCPFSRHSRLFQMTSAHFRGRRC